MKSENGSKHQSEPVMASSNFMILEVGVPGAGTLNERLHHGFLGLYGVVQVVRGPFMQ
jgi:hypothetical protein